MPRVVHFEFSAQQPERAVKFYSTVFGWELTKWAGPVDYYLIKTGEDSVPGINGGGFTPPEMAAQLGPTTVTIDVPSVDEYIAKITANGGEIVVPKMPIPGVGWLAYFKDTEGVAVGIMQPDPTAA